MKHKTRGFIAMILALCLMMSLGIGALAVDEFDGGDSGKTTDTDMEGPGSYDYTDDPAIPKGGGDMEDDKTPDESDPSGGAPAPQQETRYNINVKEDTGVTVTFTSGVFEGTTQSKEKAHVKFRVEATLVDGQTLEVKVNGNVPNVTEGIYNFVMPAADVTVTAEIISESHDITVAQAEHGRLNVVSSAEVGQTVTFTPVPDAGYEFEGVVVTKSGDTTQTVSVNGNSFVMPNFDVTITATFKEKDTKPEPPVKEYDVVVHEVSGGFVIANPTKAAAGTTIKLTAGSDFRHYLIGYTVITESGTKLKVTNDSFVMPNEDVYVTGVFGTYQEPADWHSIDVSCPYYCDVDVASWAYENDTVTFTVDPWYYYDYYSVGVWTDGGVKLSVKSLGNDKYSFTMPDDDVTIYVDYDYVGTYSITKDVEGDGSIYVRSSADKGDTVWIEASPNAGQSLTSLRVFYGEPWAYGDKGYYGYWDEAEVKYSTYWDAYYFTMPADDVVVYARFTDGATVTVTSGDHGSAKVSSRYAEKGDWVYITAYPDDGYEVADVTVVDRLGKSVKVTELSSDYFLFTMPGTSVDVKVTFREVDYGYFYDVSRGDWYYEAVRYVYEKGIMEGTSAHYFSPNADLSRGMLATILYRLEGSPNVSGYSSFNDVADTSYYAKAIAWAERNGIVNGVTTERFEPDTAVTREQMAAILCRYADYKGHDTSVSYDYLATFGDSGSSHVYARPALNWAVAHRIINGQGSSVLAPRATATRAEVAQVLMNYLEAYD